MFQSLLVTIKFACFSRFSLFPMQREGSDDETFTDIYFNVYLK